MPNERPSSPGPRLVWGPDTFQHQLPPHARQEEERGGRETFVIRDPVEIMARRDRLLRTILAAQIHGCTEIVVVVQRGSAQARTMRELVDEYINHYYRPDRRHNPYIRIEERSEDHFRHQGNITLGAVQDIESRQIDSPAIQHQSNVPGNTGGVHATVRQPGGISLLLLSPERGVESPQFGTPLTEITAQQRRHMFRAMIREDLDRRRRNNPNYRVQTAEVCLDVYGGHENGLTRLARSIGLDQELQNRFTNSEAVLEAFNALRSNSRDDAEFFRDTEPQMRLLYPDGSNVTCNLSSADGRKKFDRIMAGNRLAARVMALESNARAGRPAAERMRIAPFTPTLRQQQAMENAGAVDPGLGVVDRLARVNEALAGHFRPDQIELLLCEGQFGEAIAARVRIGLSDRLAASDIPLPRRALIPGGLPRDLTIQQAVQIGQSLGLSITDGTDINTARRLIEEKSNQNMGRGGRRG